MIVVDSNLLAYLALRTPTFSELAEKVLLRDDEWVSPELWRYEVLNVFCTYIREGLLQRDTAEKGIDYLDEVIGPRSFVVDAKKVLASSEKTKCSGYDSHFVVLAEELGLKLVTHDKRVLLHAPHVAVSPEQFLAA